MLKPEESLILLTLPLLSLANHSQLKGTQELNGNGFQQYMISLLFSSCFPARLFLNTCELQKYCFADQQLLVLCMGCAKIYFRHHRHHHSRFLSRAENGSEHKRVAQKTFADYFCFDESWIVDLLQVFQFLYSECQSRATCVRSVRRNLLD